MAKEGYIGLFRCLLDKPIWKKSTPEQKAILITLLLMVNHDESEWEWQGEKFKVVPGQTVTSLEKIAEECGKGISIQNVRTALTRFEKLDFLTNKSTKTGRLITIENWELYQVERRKPNKDTNKDLTKTSQTPNKDLTPNNNDNNDKNDKKNTISDYTANENLRQTIKDFMDMRKQIKSPLTDKGLELMLGKLSKLPTAINDAAKIAILNQSIENSWKGIFDLKEMPKVEQEQPKKRRLTLEERMKD